MVIVLCRNSARDYFYVCYDLNDAVLVIVNIAVYMEIAFWWIYDIDPVFVPKKFSYTK